MSEVQQSKGPPRGELKEKRPQEHPQSVEGGGSQAGLWWTLNPFTEGLLPSVDTPSFIPHPGRRWQQSVEGRGTHWGSPIGI